MSKIRTFIAIEIPSSIKKSIAQLQQTLKTNEANVSWVKADNIHITLKFLGDVEENRIERIAAVLEDAVREISRFTITIGGVGGFPNVNRPRVLWVSGFGHDQIVEDIVKRIENALHSIGFEAEKKKFTIHLTIGRVRDQKNIERITENLLQQKDFKGGTFDVAEIVLMKSELNPAGSIYTPLQIIKLKS
ncbi:RNA 2',3'-cyclic phosphodiesterase [candidate division KSB1 bacterium]|nr:RNA 2',3'-cyclic phosphodiesterase [candidate division KSB1 bacterium]